MKGVTFSGLRQGAKCANETRSGRGSWRIAPVVIAVLLLSPMLWVSGSVSALPNIPSVSVREVAGPRLEITIGTMTVEMIEHAGGYLFTYRQAGAVYRVAVVESPDGVRYSIDGGAWRGVPLEFERTPSVVEKSFAGSIQGPDFHRDTRYWWDGVRFMRGYPTVYPHPDRDY
ncbi:MAG: hypothetical protein ACE5LS_03465, partial [Thermoplasmata archaeon]